MDAILEGGFASLHLNSVESAVTEISIEEAGEQSTHHGRLLGKLLMLKDQDIRKIRATFSQSWGCVFSVERLRGNIYQFDFEKPVDASRVLANGPWCFSNVLLVLCPWNPDWDKGAGFFSSVHFWVQVWGIPLRYCVEGVAARVLEILGGVGVCQLREEPGTGCRLFRFRAPIDLACSLTREIQLTINGVSVVGKLRYERLPIYCFACGKLDHMLDSCPIVSRELSILERNLLPYNPSLLLRANRRTHLVRELQLGFQQPVLEHGLCTDRAGTEQGQHMLKSHACGQSISVRKPTLLREGFTSIKRPVVVPNSIAAREDLVSNQESPQSLSPHTSPTLSKPIFPPDLFQNGLGHFAHSFMTEFKRTQASVANDLLCSVVNVLAGVRASTTVNCRSAMIKETNTTTLNDGCALVDETGAKVHDRKKGDVTCNDINKGDHIFNALPVGDEFNGLGKLNTPYIAPFEGNNLVGTVQAASFVPPSVAPILSNLLSRAINNSGSLGSTGATHDASSLRGLRSWSRRPRLQGLGGDDYLNDIRDHLHNNELGELGDSNDNVLMHIDTGKQVEMDRKRKIEDGVDGESSMKKTRLTISEPLVEPAELQAHPAP